MNVLFLTQVLPYPLDAGPKVRAYHVLQQLSRNHTVTLATFVRAGDPPEAIRHLETLVGRLIICPIQRSRLQTAGAMARSLVGGEPLMIARDRVADMFAKLRTAVIDTPFNLIHADQLWMAPYALAAAREASPESGRPRLVLDQHNAVHLIPRRLAVSSRNRLVRAGWQREAGLMARYERQTCQAFDQVVTVTAEDAQALAGLYPPGKAPTFNVIPICIDLSLTQPQAWPEDSPNLLFIGGMHWPPNADGIRWFAEAILPAICAGRPQTRRFAVGRQPPEELHHGPASGFIEAPGYVDYPQHFWAGSQVFVVPLRAGGGMRVKILDAWARGVPVVSTTIGAEGLKYRAGDDILIADSPADFAAAVIAILTDPALARRLAAAGRNTVERHYDWRRIYPAWETVYAGRE
jgi:glycosyltransferase involved in cell wall biosynthesis